MTQVSSRIGRTKVTLKDVALAAGVTPMTVSNVLNGRQGQVSADTRTRVMAAIERLGYRPNAVARRLREQRSLAIGMLVLDDVPEYLNDHFTSQVIAGLSNIATEHGYSLVLQGVRSSTLESAPLLAQIETDGVCAILSGSKSQRRRLVDRLVGMRLPVVLIQERHKAPLVCCVRQDDKGGAAEVARHLIDGGARKIFMLLPGEEWPAIDERQKGVRAVCEDAGAELLFIRCGDEGVEDTRAALAEALEEHGLPDAILGGNDRMAVAAMMHLIEAGIDVPEEVRVTGFNGFEWGHFGLPRLTTVRSSAYQIGQRAGAELLNYFKHERFTGKDIVLPVSFVPGQTS